jgi:hypothetical protein
VKRENVDTLPFVDRIWFLETKVVPDEVEISSKP